MSDEKKKFEHELDKIKTIADSAYARGDKDTLDYIKRKLDDITKTARGS